ncbi:hypothetical protein LJ725_24325 [Reyranella aquatilis]|uniref:Uncharacterized protein n=1 Tax=Reyranella aquatilis TaxID=2035356 RepID=A0ABS8L198_9HYPH|nr:hypothetical protein [Reyranella aquatilis]MCC8432114.1 hypothetical protein [Reyranella aquatilis]
MAKRGRPKGARSALTLAERFAAVANGGDPHADRALTATELAALVPADARPAGVSVRKHLLAVAAPAKHKGDEFERLRKLRQRRGYEFDAD